jgi:hypothetical protein
VSSGGYSKEAEEEAKLPVIAVTGRISHSEDERLSRIHCLTAVSLPGINTPHNFVEKCDLCEIRKNCLQSVKINSTDRGSSETYESNRVSRRARSALASDRVSHVREVIRRLNIDTVPARRESNLSAETIRAVVRRKVGLTSG